MGAVTVTVGVTNAGSAGAAPSVVALSAVVSVAAVAGAGSVEGCTGAGLGAVGLTSSGACICPMIIANWASCTNRMQARPAGASVAIDVLSSARIASVTSC